MQLQIYLNEFWTSITELWISSIVNNPWLNYGYNTLLGKRYTPFKAIKSIWMPCLCFQWAEIDTKFTYDCSPKKSDLDLAGLSLQCQLESSISKTAAYVVISPNLPSHCGKIESTIAYFFSSLTDCSNAPSNPIRMVSKIHWHSLSFLEVHNDYTDIHNPPTRTHAHTHNPPNVMRFVTEQTVNIIHALVLSQLLVNCMVILEKWCILVCNLQMNRLYSICSTRFY